MNTLALMSLGLAPLPPHGRAGRIISRDDQAAPAPATPAVADQPAPKHEADKDTGAAQLKRAKQKTGIRNFRLIWSLGE